MPFIELIEFKYGKLGKDPQIDEEMFFPEVQPLVEVDCDETLVDDDGNLTEACETKKGVLINTSSLDKINTFILY